MYIEREGERERESVCVCVCEEEKQRVHTCGVFGLAAHLCMFVCHCICVYLPVTE